tara:strand:+ start:461 stop:1072 length:612 start_codon:yes stop_codon:yes gene_type:complete
MSWKEILKEERKAQTTMPKHLVYEWDMDWKKDDPNNPLPENWDGNWGKDASTLMISNDAQIDAIQDALDALNKLGIKTEVADLLGKNTPDDFSGHLDFGVAVRASQQGKSTILYFATDTEAYWDKADYPTIVQVHLPFELTDASALTAMVMRELGHSVGLKEDTRYSAEKEKELYRQLRAEEIDFYEFRSAMNAMGHRISRGH